MNKEKRQKRFQQKDRYIKRQKAYVDTFFPEQSFRLEQEMGRLAKVSWCTCGNSNCVMCGNPRKFFGELTIQEKKQQDYSNSFGDEE